MGRKQQNEVSAEHSVMPRVGGAQAGGDEEAETPQVRWVWSCVWQQVVGNNQRHGLTEFRRKIQRFKYILLV